MIGRAEIGAGDGAATLGPETAGAGDASSSGGWSITTGWRRARSQNSSTMRKITAMAAIM
jgi:hypothetical protein